jgi:hypothetical protein
MKTRFFDSERQQGELPNGLETSTHPVHAEATSLITNDPVFVQVGSFETLILDRFV